MAYLIVNHVEIKGVACAVPKQVKYAKDQPFFTEIEAENFTSVTGVECSRTVPDGMTCSDLCQAAAERLLEESGWEKDSINMMVFVTASRDFFVYPNTANILQDKLGLSDECMAFDLPFACSGYVYGLSVASSMMQTGNIKRALLLVGETNSKIQNPEDKTVWALHGDAGSATLLEYNEEAKHPMQFHVCSDGAGWEAIICKEMGARYPATAESLIPVKIDEGIVRAPWECNMDGMSVFSFAITRPGQCIKGLCEHFEFELTTIDYLLIHQANKMIDEKLRKKLKLAPEQVPYSMMQFGNTSSCTIPITMITQISEQLRTKENNLVMCGFGSGLSWGAAHVYIDNIIVPELVEI